MTTPQDTVRLFRHVRNGKNGQVSNLGGVTMYIQLDFIQPGITVPQMTFSLAICDDDENFDASIAKSIAEGRFKAGQTVSGYYHQKQSLVQNAIYLLQDAIDVCNGIENSDSPTVNVKKGLLEAALIRLNRYTKRLPRAPFTGEGLKGRDVKRPTLDGVPGFIRTGEKSGILLG